MALITKENIEKIDKERNSVHGKVRASYTSFQSGGKTFFFRSIRTAAQSVNKRIRSPSQYSWTANLQKS